MSYNSTLVYENAQLEQFEKSIYSGHLTEESLQAMIDNGQVTEAQLRVVAELAPVFGGLANVAKGALGGIKNGVQRGKQALQQGVQNVKNTYQQGAQNQQNVNRQRAQAKMWKKIDQTITQARLLEQLEAFRKTFPQDKFVNDATGYFNKVLLELQQYLGTQYPYMQIQPQQGFQHQSELGQNKAMAGGERTNPQVRQ